ncbi:hypothetical protein, partial [Frankia sp. EI5c]|uniref:hypothetical protein n=1 Tax=Frankia sp. EI5c TaxID=683316 RepID=UPI0037C17D3E
LNGVEAFKTIQADPNNVPQIRADHSEWGLLLKPAMHMVIFKAVIKAAERGTPRDLAISRLNKLPWHIKDGLWENVIVSGGSRITARSENFEVTAELIAYLIGREGNTPEIRERARARVAHYRGMDDYELPDPIA